MTVHNVIPKFHCRHQSRAQTGEWTGRSRFEDEEIAEGQRCASVVLALPWGLACRARLHFLFVSFLSASMYPVRIWLSTHGTPAELSRPGLLGFKAVAGRLALSATTRAARRKEDMC